MRGFEHKPGSRWPECRCPACLDEQDAEDERLRKARPPLVRARDYLHAFLREDDGPDPKLAQKALLLRLRDVEEEAFNIIADMIDPAGQSYWRLELKRRGGRMNKAPTAEQQLLAKSYEWRLKHLKKEGRPSPEKTARGEIAAYLGMTDEAVRAIIRRAQGRKVRTPAQERKVRKR